MTLEAAPGAELRRPPFSGRAGHMTKTMRHTTIALATLAALTAVVGAGAVTTRGHAPELSLRWQAPTPRDGTAYAVKAGEPLLFELSAGQGSVIRSRRLPAGVFFAASSGHARVQWTPSVAQVGEHMLTFGARKASRYARPRSFLVYVLPATPAGPHDDFPLGGINGMSRYAQVYADVSARTRPSSRAKALIRLRQYTPEGSLSSYRVRQFVQLIYSFLHQLRLAASLLTLLILLR